MVRSDFREQADRPTAEGTVARIVRYPVKSMRGEDLYGADLTPHGLAFDRLYALESEAAPPGMLRVAGHERQQLLRFSANHRSSATYVTTPEGVTFAVEDPLLLAALPAGFSPTTLTWSASPQTDCRPLSLISLQSVAELGRELACPLDPLRFRANLYLDLPAPFGEDSLVGHTVQVGSEATLEVTERDPRCRFITFDPVTTEPAPELMRLLHRRHGGRAGVYARVLTPGRVCVGDRIWVTSGDRT